MSATYDPIASTTLSSSASSVTFSSLDTIAAGYRDLVLVIQPSISSFPNWLGIRFNSDAGANYYIVEMKGNGSTTSSSTALLGSLQIRGQMQGTNTGVYTFQIFDFAEAKHKSVLGRGGSATGAGTPEVTATAGRWASTSAVTEITALMDASVSFGAGSVLSLYGIVA